LAWALPKGRLRESKEVWELPAPGRKRHLKAEPWDLESAPLLWLEAGQQESLAWRQRRKRSRETGS
jgi:hypothetical protein